jgi:hypothetical protein
MSGKWVRSGVATAFAFLHQRQLIPLTNGAAEYADVTENVIKIAKPVLEALKDPKIQPYFRSLSVRLPTLRFPSFHPDPFL